MNDERASDGGCLCGAVRFRIRGQLRDVLICHCRMCQRQATLAGAFTACAVDRLEVLQGECRWYAASPEAERGFCTDCGSLLFWRPRHGRHISISLGALDTRPDVGPAGELFEENRDERLWPR